MSTVTFHLFTLTLANAMTMVYGLVWYTGSIPCIKTSVPDIYQYTVHVTSDVL